MKAFARPLSFRRAGVGRARAAQSARWLLCALLLATGLTKAADLTGFAGVVETYRVLPVSLVLPASVLLTTTEVGLAAWLASGVWLRRAAACAGLLHCIYAAWTGWALLRGLALPNCGCFGVFLARPLAASTLLEDVVLVGVSAVAWWGANY